MYMSTTITLFDNILKAKSVTRNVIVFISND